MFVPHVVVRPRTGGRSPKIGRRAAPHLVVAAVFGCVAPVLGYLVEGRAHGAFIAAGAACALLAAGLGFGVARTIGRQGRI